MMTLEKYLNYTFNSSELCQKALTHKSYANENPSESLGHNERLEFLGDAVLDLIFSEWLFEEYSSVSEGELSKLRASLVNETTFSEVAREIGLDQRMLLGRGEAASGGATKPRLLASVFEALIGAIYLDSDYDRCLQVVRRLFLKRFAELNHDSPFAGDFKTRFQEKAQQLFRETPTYRVIREEGPDHDKTFFVEAVIGDKVIASGEGRSKKLAEQNAAEKALENL